VIHLTEQNNSLCLDGVSLSSIAQAYGTPCYVYGQSAIEAQYRALDEAFTIPHQICYAVKANGSLAILNILQRLGSGFDIVSGGELARVIKAGGNPANVYFSGVGKSTDEITFALQSGIACLNVESIEELERIQEIASLLNVIAPIALRINPHIDVKTHRYIATGLKGHKFGIPYEEAPALIKRLPQFKNVRLTGLACHLGSQLTEIDAYESSAKTLFELADAYPEPLRFLSLGGGMGITYRDEAPMDIATLGARISALFETRHEMLVLEPGRFIIAPAGLLLTRIEYLKKTDDKHFAVVDAGMNDLIRPALYEAWHDIRPVQTRNIPAQAYDVVGPVCESGDFFGHNRSLSVEADDVLAILDAGAYGMVMSSHYNARPRACEVLIRNEAPILIRERETYDDLWKQENTAIY
jgi:diaminopimelate decarboxylase